MQIIDLSTPLYSGMAVYPGDPAVTIKVDHHLEKEGWELRRLTMGSHAGTHVDAFSHMHKGKLTIDEIPLNRFFGPAQVVTVADDWPSGMGLFFREKIGVTLLKRLLEKNPNFVGGEMSEELERSLLEEEIVTYTGLVNVHLLPLNQEFLFYGFPLKIQDGDGSPVRAIAIID